MAYTNQVELAESLKKGSKSAYDSLFREFYMPLVLYSESLTKDKDISENIVQSVFCQIWENRKELFIANTIKGYLYTSVKNKSLTHLRDNKKFDLIAEIPDKGENNIAKSILETEIYSELYSSINRLPKMCRKVLFLKLQGLKNEEIAENLGKSKDTVKSHLKNGYKLIKNDLEEVYYLLTFLFLKKD